MLLSVYAPRGMHPQWDKQLASMCSDQLTFSIYYVFYIFAVAKAFTSCGCGEPS